MIGKGAARNDAGQLGAYLGDYQGTLAGYLAKEKNDRAGVLEIRGSSFNDLERALRSWECEAVGTRCKKPLWHAQLRGPDGEHLTRQQQQEAVDILERHLGLQGQPRAIVIHENAGQEHLHVVWSRIDRETGKARRDSFTHKKNVAAAREIEQRFGLQVVESPGFEKEGTREERREKSKKSTTYKDHQKAKRSDLDPNVRKRTITALWRECDSGKALRAGLQEAGYVLARGDSRNFVVVDQAGDIHSLARQIKDAYKADVDERLKDLDPASIPKATHIRQKLYFAWKEQQPKQERAKPPETSRDAEPKAKDAPNADHAAKLTEKEKPKKDHLDPATILADITQTKSTFTAGDLDYEIRKRRDAAELPSDITAEDKLTKAVFQLPDLVRLGNDRVDSMRYTSLDMLKTELSMRDHSDYLKSLGRHAVTDEKRDAAPAADGLGQQQKTAYQHVTSDRALDIVTGYAGTGKSKMLQAARQAWVASGYRVHGVALSGMAAESLQNGSDIDSRTLRSFFGTIDRLAENEAKLTAMDERIASIEGSTLRERKMRFDLQTDRDRFDRRIAQNRLTEKDVIVLDEAAMVGSRDMEKLLSNARKANAKVVLVGDAEQLQAIDAGGAFRALADRHGSVKISKVRRQHEEWAQRATENFGDGYTDEALKAYKDRGFIHERETHADAREQMISAWKNSRAASPEEKHLMMAFTKVDVAELNKQGREAYKAEGKVSDGETVQTATGKKEFGAGDRLYFLAPDRTLGVKNGSLGTVTSVEASSMRPNSHNMTVTLDTGRAVTFNTGDYDKFDLGYAAVVHKSQGATADRAHILASKYMDRHAAYVAMTRQRTQVDMFYGADEFRNYEGLVRSLSRDRRKDTTLDYLSRAENAGRRESFLDRILRHTPVQRENETSLSEQPLTRSERIKRTAERMANKLDLSVNPARREERKEQRAAAVQAARLRRMLGERPDKHQRETSIEAEP